MVYNDNRGVTPAYCAGVGCILCRGVLYNTEYSLYRVLLIRVLSALWAENFDKQERRVFL